MSGSVPTHKSKSIENSMKNFKHFAVNCGSRRSRMIAKAETVPHPDADAEASTDVHICVAYVAVKPCGFN